MRTLPPSLDLDGRVAVVTGAGSGSGIGFATARALGALGARLVITGTTDRIRDRAAELADAGIEVVPVVTRLEHERGAAAVADACAAAGWTPAVLVNNAGMVTVGAEMEGGDVTVPPDTWRRALDTNLTSAFLVTRVLVAGMRGAGWGRIVTVASVTGPVMASRADVGYAAAKAGLVGLTRALAVDEAPRGITANAVAPGWIVTGSQLPNEADEGLLVPARRSGTADEVASAIAWLCTPGAAYTTGQVLVVDGGNSVGEERAPSR